MIIGMNKNPKFEEQGVKCIGTCEFSVYVLFFYLSKLIANIYLISFESEK